MSPATSMSCFAVLGVVTSPRDRPRSDPFAVFARASSSRAVITTSYPVRARKPRPSTEALARSRHYGCWFHRRTIGADLHDHIGPGGSRHTVLGLGRVCESVLDGVQRSLRAVGDTELAQHVRHVRLHGLLGDGQFAGDLRFDRPAAIRRSTSRSRAVRSVRCALSVFRRRPRASSFSAMDGDRIDSPAATLRIASASLDPAPIPSRGIRRRLHGSREDLVVGRERRERDDLRDTSRSRRVASMPSTFGIARSMSTTSGFNDSASSIACAPSSASPTTSIPSTVARNVLSPPRTTGWSSAIRTRISDIDDHARSGPRLGLDVQLFRRPLSHVLRST